MSKGYRLKVKKIPLNSVLQVYEPNFPPLENLYLDMLENKEKLKKNAPKPIFVRDIVKNEKSSSSMHTSFASNKNISENDEENYENEEINDGDDFMYNELLN